MDRAARALTELDAAIAGASSSERPGLVIQLAARLAQLGAGLAEMPVSVPPQPDENLGVDEAARRLAVSPRYLYRNAKTLPFAVRIGRRLVFSTRGLERWNAHRGSKA